MKKKDIVTGKVIYSEFPNMGVVETEEGPVRVKNVVPGQEISVRITKKRNGIWRGDPVAVEAEPGDAIESDCRHYGLTPTNSQGDISCGSCLYRNISYERELEIKRDQLRRLLGPILDFDRLFEGIDPSPLESGYRNKMEVTFGDASFGGELELGLHRRASFYDIVSSDGCRLTHPDIDMVRAATLDFFRQRQLPYYHKRNHEGYLRHLLVRRSESEGALLVDLVTSTDAPENEESMLSDYTAVLRELPIEGSFAGILHTHNDRTADAVCNEGTDILYGEDHFTEELLGLSFNVTVFSFFQTNSAGAEVLYGRVRYAIYDIVDACGLDSPLIYDLYSGTGTIAQVLAPVAGEVCGVEIVEEAVEAASENAALNGLSNCSFICGDVLRVLDDLSRKPDIIILDPPRDGVHPGALPKIIAYGVSHIIYIACKATSLARDLPVFFEGGYEVSTMRAVDMFPRTPNTEVICVLSRRGTQDQVCEIYLNLRKSL